MQVAQNFERSLNKGANGQKQSVICAKVVVVSTVSRERTWVPHRRRRGVGGRREFRQREPKLRPSSAPAPASVLVGTCTTSTRSGRIWTNTTVLSAIPTCRIGRFRPMRGGRHSHNPGPHSSGSSATASRTCPTGDAGHGKAVVREGWFRSLKVHAAEIRRRDGPVQDRIRETYDGVREAERSGEGSRAPPHGVEQNSPRDGTR